MASTSKSTAIVGPNYGLYLGRPSILIPAKGLEACLNVRVRLGKISSFNMGWTKFSPQQLNGPVTQIDNFFKSDGSSILIVGTLTDLYRWDAVNEEFLYITETYATGTAAASGTAVTGTGTAWATLAIDGENARPGDEIAFGSATADDPAGTWFTINSVNSDTSITLTASAGTVANGPYTIRRKFNSGNIFNYWRTITFPRADITGTGTPIVDTWFATNGGQDHPVHWDGVTPAVVRFDPGFKTQEFVRFKNMLFYVNIVMNGGEQKPLSFLNSDAGRPLELGTGLAGEFVAAPGTAAIITALPIGDNLAIYTENEVVLMTFVGAPDIFAFRTAVTGTGLLAGRLVAQFTDTHQFLGRDSLYDFNGIQASAIDEHVWVDILRRQDNGRLRAAHIIFDEEYGDLIWAFPLSSETTVANEPRSAYVAHYLETLPPGVPTPYTFRDFPFSSAGFYQRDDVLTWQDLTEDWTNYNFAWTDRFFASAFPLILGGSPDGFIYTLHTVDSHDGTGFVSSATFGRRFVGDYRSRNLVKRVYVMLSQQPSTTYPVKVSLEMFETEGQVVGNKETMEYDMAQVVTNFVAPYRRGRVGQVSFQTDGSPTGQPWQLHGYDLDIVPGGKR